MQILDHTQYYVTDRARAILSNYKCQSFIDQGDGVEPTVMLTFKGKIVYAYIKNNDVCSALQEAADKLYNKIIDDETVAMCDPIFNYNGEY